MPRDTVSSPLARFYEQFRLRSIALEQVKDILLKEFSQFRLGGGTKISQYTYLWRSDGDDLAPEQVYRRPRLSRYKCIRYDVVEAED